MSCSGMNIAGMSGKHRKYPYEIARLKYVLGLKLCAENT